MFLRRINQNRQENRTKAQKSSGASRGSPRAGSVEGGDWDLMDMRTGKIIAPNSETETGVPISAEGAYAYHAWYRAISLIAQKCAAVPKHLYRPSTAPTGRTGEEGRERATDHSAYKLIHRRANSEQTAFQFWLQMAGHTASRGNGFAYLSRVATKGPVEELIPMDPDKTHPIRKDGELWYVVFPFGETGAGRKIRATEVAHFKGFGFDGLVGYPVWEIAANEIGLARAERKLESVRYKNSGRPSMVLQTDMKLPDKTKRRIISDWEKMYVGLDNAGKTAILDGGLKATTIGMSAKDLEQSGAAQMSLVAISNYTGVPVSKLGGSRAFATAEQEDRAFINDCLDFYLNTLDDEASAKILSELEQDTGYYVKSHREALLRPDTKTKFEVLRVATAGRAFMTPNEARESIDLPPSEDKDANSLLTPLNMGQGGMKNESTDPAGDDAGRPESDGFGSSEEKAAAVAPSREALLREAARSGLALATARMLKRATAQAKAAADRVGYQVGYRWFCDSFVSENARTFRSEFRTSERVASVLTGDRPKDGEAADYLLQLLAKEYRALAGSSRPILVAQLEALSARLALTLPQQIADVFLPVTPEG